MGKHPISRYNMTLGVDLPVSKVFLSSSSSICSSCSISFLLRLYQTSELVRIEFMRRDSLRILATSNWFDILMKLIDHL